MWQAEVRELLKPPDNAEATFGQIRKAINCWSADPSGPVKMVVPLEDEHVDLSELHLLKELRSLDRARAEALLQLAQVRTLSSIAMTLCTNTSSVVAAFFNVVTSPS